MRSKAPEEKSLHDRIVEDILPDFADRLKEEGVISNDDRKRFTITISKDLRPMIIHPDRVLYTTDGKKVLVEVANPKETKRFFGEITYPRILAHQKKISKAIVFVLNHSNGTSAPKFVTWNWILSDTILNSQVPVISLYWPSEENIAYLKLKSFLTSWSV